VSPSVSESESKQEDGRQPDCKLLKIYGRVVLGIGERKLRMIIVTPTCCSFDLFVFIRGLPLDLNLFPVTSVVADLCLGGSGAPDSDGLYTVSAASIYLLTTNFSGGDPRTRLGLGCLGVVPG